MTSVPLHSMLLLSLATTTRFFQVEAFLRSQPTSYSSRSIHHYDENDCRYRPLQSGDFDDDDFDDIELTSGPEKSQLGKFVNQYLGKEKPASSAVPIENEAAMDSKVVASSTHLVAIPMESCHELLIELESVQRAILYHCPILTDACIPGSMTRLPLLYVDADEESPSHVTGVLAKTVQKLSKKYLFVTPGEDSEVSEEELNEDGIQPVTITFQSLEIDGSNNNVLTTVGKTGEEGTKNLQAFVKELRTSIQARGWKTSFPIDEHAEKANTNEESSGDFRPRIPFMELPRSFDRNLSKLKSEGMEISEEDMKFMSSDEGGNGISPIFWCQWWDDVFGRNVRLREVGIFPRTQAGNGLAGNDDLSYNEFCLPYETIALPDGYARMLKNEKQFEKYQDQRLQEEREKLFNDNKDASEKANPYEEPDILMSKTRERLENIYIGSDGEEASILEEGGAQDVEEPKQETIKPEQQDDEDDDEDIVIEPITASPDDYIDDWMKERIKNVVGNMESIKSRQPQEKKVKPPIEDNPVFKAYKEGTLVPKSQKTTAKPKRELPPYPSREHFIGIWKVVTSPTGLETEESSAETSENLILRVDGTTAGGPVLDPETNQKAAGGTWRMIEENGDVKLRIRLVIPPKKERIIEMFGIIDRFSVGNDIPMASKAFGVPHLEEMAKENLKSDREDVIQCSGDVHIEDAVTKKNRKAIGTFNLMKLQNPMEKGQYTITIPKPVRNQD